MPMVMLTDLIANANYMVEQGLYNDFINDGYDDYEPEMGQEIDDERKIVDEQVTQTVMESKI